MSVASRYAKVAVAVSLVMYAVVSRVDLTARAERMSRRALKIIIRRKSPIEDEQTSKRAGGERRGIRTVSSDNACDLWLFRQSDRSPPEKRVMPGAARTRHDRLIAYKVV